MRLSRKDNYLDFIPRRNDEGVSFNNNILCLGELLHQANQNLPGECGSLSHCLPLLLERAAGNDSLQRMRATQAITALLMLSRSKLSASCSNPTSLYLAQIINAAPKTKDAAPKRFNEAHSARLSKVTEALNSLAQS